MDGGSGRRQPPSGKNNWKINPKVQLSKYGCVVSNLFHAFPMESKVSTRHLLCKKAGGRTKLVIYSFQKLSKCLYQGRRDSSRGSGTAARPTWSSSRWDHCRHRLSTGAPLLPFLCEACRFQTSKFIMVLKQFFKPLPKELHQAYWPECIWLL